MKIGIVTIQSVNYGNRLQNYALQAVLEDNGTKVYSLRREPKTLKQCLKKAGRIILKNDSRAQFYRFNNRYIHFSRAVLNESNCNSKQLGVFDSFVIGSDQVWNPDFDFNSELEYLPMVPAEKKVAYAASFGVNEITENRKRTAELLDGVGFISVREVAGAKIVHDLTGRDVPVVLDPTLLLGPADWEKVSAKPKKVDCDSPYVFKYVLGNDVNDRRIASLASSRGLKVIDVMDDTLAIGPSEFVWLIAHSELVCTDSFHASVFALLHHKPLAIYERVSADADMSSRFDTLCSNFGLVGHRSSEGSFGDDAIFSTDWNDVDARLAALRESSLAWLKGALGGVARG